MKGEAAQGTGGRLGREDSSGFFRSCVVKPCIDLLLVVPHVLHNPTSIGHTPSLYRKSDMPRLRFLICILLLTLTTFSHATASNPNIIFILSDDQGFGDVSALNPESKIPTPNIDRSATEGMIFSDGHSSSAVCTPTRYSVLTGRYHWRTHLQNGVLGGFSKPLISKGRLTVASLLHLCCISVASLLKQQGYATACIGKWHPGWDWPLKSGGTANDEGNFSGGFRGGWDVDYAGEIQNGPCDLGFDYFFGISASLDMPPYVYV